MKIAKFFSNIFSKSIRRKYQELEEKYLESKSLISELESKLAEKDETIKRLESENDTLKRNPYMALVDRQTDAYVLDASFSGCKNFNGVYKKIIESQSKIILTSITIRELKKLCLYVEGKRVTESSIKANRILSDATKYPDKFIKCYVKRTINPDDNIIDFCVRHLEHVTLLTSDKEMALLAESRGVKVEYYRTKSEGNFDFTKILTLSHDNCITEFDTDNKYIMVKSGKNGKKITSGKYKISSGDEIFAIIKNENVYRFFHYRINKSQVPSLIYNRLFSINDIESLPRKEYKKFVQDYLSKQEEQSS